MSRSFDFDAHGVRVSTARFHQQHLHFSGGRIGLDDHDQRVSHPESHRAHLVGGGCHLDLVHAIDRTREAM